MRVFIDKLVYKLAVLTDKLADILWETKATQRYVIREAINEQQDYPYTYYEGIYEHLRDDWQYDGGESEKDEYLQKFREITEQYSDELMTSYPNYETPAKNTPPDMNPIEKMLNDAIEREDYELAAQLKLDLERYNSKKDNEPK